MTAFSTFILSIIKVVLYAHCIILRTMLNLHMNNLQVKFFKQCSLISIKTIWAGKHQIHGTEYMSSPVFVCIFANRSWIHTTWIYVYLDIIPRNTLRWRRKERDGVLNHQPHGCLLNRLFRHTWQKTSKLCVTGLCVGNSPETGEFPTQMASNAENIPIWWRHHDTNVLCFTVVCCGSV